MKIGVMGLGNIAQKAYLPILGAKNSEVTWVYHTRDKQTLDDLAKQYGWEHYTSDFHIFINSGLDAVMIHTPTQTHAALIEMFLKRGIHVFVDKPISNHLEEVLALHELAQAQSCVLMTGFNRRYAPFNQKLKLIEDKNLIILQKHREKTKQEAAFALYDMMIHIVDTAVFLLDEPVVDVQTKVQLRDEKLSVATLHLYTENSSAFVTINMFAGTRLERVEVMSPNGYHCVDNLDHLTQDIDGIHNTQSFSDWTPTLEKRGFVTMLDTFIDAIKNKTSFDSIETHRYISMLVDAIPKETL